MRKVAIITDSSSGISINETKDSNIFVLPIPFVINDEEYFEDISLSRTEFYEKQGSNSNISTSQPSPYAVTELWDRVLKSYDEIVHIPMSCGLSASCNSAKSYAENYKNVYVVDNQRISVSQKQSVYDAKKLADRNYTAQQIKEYLEKTKRDSSIYIMVNTLKYLKKGGRVTAAGAALGTLFNIKPVLQIQGEKLDAYTKTLSVAQAKNKMIQAVKNDLATVYNAYYKNDEMEIAVAHTNNLSEATKFASEIEKAFPDFKVKYIDELSLGVACHIGPGSLAIFISRVVQ